MNLRVAAIESNVDRPLNLAASGKEQWKHGADIRDVWLSAKEDWSNVSSVAREALKKGATLEGPAIVEDASSTLVIPPGASAFADPAGNLIVEFK